MAWKPALIGLRRGIERLPTSRARETSLETKGENEKRTRRSNFSTKVKHCFNEHIYSKAKIYCDTIIRKIDQIFPHKQSLRKPQNPFQNPISIIRRRPPLITIARSIQTHRFH